MQTSYRDVACRTQDMSDSRAVRQASPETAWLVKQIPSEPAPIPLPEPRRTNVPPETSAKPASHWLALPMSVRVQSSERAPASAGVADAESHESLVPD